MCLIGSFIQNINLMDQYEDSLAPTDFGDTAIRFIYQILQRYRDAFRCSIEETKVNSLVVDLYAQGVKFPGSLPPKKFYSTMRDFKSLGVTDPEALDGYIQTVKKYSVLRQLDALKYPTEEITQRDDFRNMTAESLLDIYASTIETLLANSSSKASVSIGANLLDHAKSLLATPEHGYSTPFEFINTYMHGFCKNDLTLIGGLSNSGKGRLLVYLLAHLICVEGQSVYLMSNEMTLDSYFNTLICTIVNSPAIQELHGKKLKLTQTEIVQSLFYDENGELIEHRENESLDEYQARLSERSQCYRDYIGVISWFQQNYGDKLHFINISDDYSPKRIKYEIKKAKRKGCSVVAMDTLKPYQSTEWGDFVQTATALSECIKSDPSGMHCIATFQLSDDAHNCKLEELNSTKIALARHIMHVADNMLMFLQLTQRSKKYYLHDSSWGEPTALPADKNFAGVRIVKNRRGGGKDEIFCLQNNLDLNRWEYTGNLIPRSSWSAAC